MYDYTAAFYSFFVEPSALPSAKASMILKFLNGTVSARVLDVGSGPGDIAFELARAGVSVTCIEPSAAMRSVFLSRLIDRRDLDARLTLLEGSALTLDLGVCYQMVYAFGLLFLLKRPEEQRLALLRLSNHLTPKGVLIANFLIGSALGEIPRHLKGERTMGETTYRHFSERTISNGAPTVAWTFETWHRGCLVDTVTESFALLPISYEACRTLIDEAGLKIEAEFGGFDGAGFDAAHSSSLVVALTRKGSMR